MLLGDERMDAIINAMIAKGMTDEADYLRALIVATEAAAVEVEVEIAEWKRWASAGRGYPRRVKAES